MQSHDEMGAGFQARLLGVVNQHPELQEPGCERVDANPTDMLKHRGFSTAKCVLVHAALVAVLFVNRCVA